ncbi:MULTISPECIES: hypothetical protein [unclassified Streptomyces]|uniref:hypothetical protein n=1 Tax=unclassified Streptomyces TaxID=2593676 RepID=UPI0033A6B3C9
MQSTLLTTMNSAAPGDMGAATRVRTVGGSLGVAVLGAVHSNRMADVLAEQLGTGVEKRLTAGGEPTPAHAPRARSGPVAGGATRALLCAAAPHSGRDRSDRDRSRRPHGRRSHIRYREDLGLRVGVRTLSRGRTPSPVRAAMRRAHHDVRRAAVAGRSRFGPR